MKEVLIMFSVLIIGTLILYEVIERTPWSSQAGEKKARKR